MRKLASVLCLLVLCAASASAQSWNLAQDPAAILTAESVVTYAVIDDTPFLTAKGDEVHEVILWRTGSGALSHTIVSSSRPAIQAQASVMNSAARGMIARPASGVTQTSVWFDASGCICKLNFEIRWNADGSMSVKRLPDDVVSGAIQ